VPFAFRSRGHEAAFAADPRWTDNKYANRSYLRPLVQIRGPPVNAVEDGDLHMLSSLALASFDDEARPVVLIFGLVPS
jgi:hypothetical protein